MIQMQIINRKEELHYQNQQYITQQTVQGNTKTMPNRWGDNPRHILNSANNIPFN